MGCFGVGFLRAPHHGWSLGCVYECINTKEADMGISSRVVLLVCSLIILFFIVAWRSVDMFDPLVSRLLCGMLLVLNSSMPFALIMLVTALVVHTIVPINQD